MATKKKIATIEDNETQAKLITAALEEGGFEVLHAFDGKKGIELVLQEHPDLIILDVILPHMSGIEVLKKIREDSWGKTVPVFMFTNLEENESLAESVESGATAYFNKSEWSMEELVNRVKEELEK